MRGGHQNGLWPVDEQTQRLEKISGRAFCKNRHRGAMADIKARYHALSLARGGRHRKPEIFFLLSLIDLSCKMPTFRDSGFGERKANK